MAKPDKRGRRQESRNPKTLIHIFCDGKTEDLYFDDLKKAFVNFVGCPIVVKVDPKGGKPKDMIPKAIERLDQLKKEGKRDGFGNAFQVWCVIDEDEHDGIPHAKVCAHAHGVHVAHSNPCIELWALYHFADHNRQSTSAEVQKELSERMPKYDHDRNRSFDFALMESNGGYEAAKKRAELSLRDRKRDENTNGNPSTNLYELLDIIRSPDHPIATTSRPKVKVPCPTS